jgi:hypothetical protein
MALTSARDQEILWAPVNVSVCKVVHKIPVALAIEGTSQSLLLENCVSWPRLHRIMTMFPLLFFGTAIIALVGTAAVHFLND